MDPAARPAETLAGHLTFALKYEGVHLEFLARLFKKVPATELEAWGAAEPSDQYARRAGLFYEYLTGRQLAFPGVAAGNHVVALVSEVRSGPGRTASPDPGGESHALGSHHGSMVAELGASKAFYYRKPPWSGAFLGAPLGHRWVVEGHLPRADG